MPRASIRRMTTDFAKTRVNARIDQVAEAQLRYVTEHTQMNVTEALKASIALLYEKVSREHASPTEILNRGLNFVGMGDSGREDVSENYKTELTRSLQQKLGSADR